MAEQVQITEVTKCLDLTQGQGQGLDPTPPPKPKSRGKHFPPTIKRHTRFYQKDLTFVVLKNEAVVHVVNFSKVNRLLVVPTDIEVERMDMSDAVTEQSMKEDSIEDIPEINEILIGKHGNGFHRGVVVEILLPKDGSQDLTPKFRVKFLDFGDEAVLGLKDLKPVNKEIMMHPIFGREVLLDGISEYNELILWSDFKSYMSGVKTKLNLLITNDADNKEKPTVVLFHRMKKTQAEKTKTINEEILELGKWQWEKKFERGCDNDLAMIAQRNEGTDLELYHWDMSTPELPVGVEMEMRILLCIDQMGLMCFPSDPRFHFAQQYRTLQAQISRYCEMVKPSPFYANDRQVYLLKIGNKWIRATRDDGIVMGIDDGRTYPLMPRQSQARALPLDFARVPSFGVQCSLLGFSEEEHLDQEQNNCLREILTPDSVHKFYIQSFKKEDGEYVLECPDVLDKLLEMKIGRNK